jgi:hypothetical protein
MPQSADQFSGIFICYRRDDCAGHAGRLHDGLAARFGDGQVFMDDEIEPGEDFVRVIEDAIGSCGVLLAVMGRGWLTSHDEEGRRLDNPNDFVRIEITYALARGIHVIPILVEGAQVPREEDLPEEMRPLLRRNAVEISDRRWKRDVKQLIGALEKIIARRREARAAEARRRQEEGGTTHRPLITIGTTAEDLTLAAADYSAPNHYSAYLSPSFFGGLIAGVPSSLPLVGGLCMFWSIVGGISAVLLYARIKNVEVHAGDGIRLGVMSGLIGSLFTVVITVLFTYSFGYYLRPPNNDRSAAILINSVLITTLITLFSVIGGMIGVTIVTGGRGARKPSV